MNFNKSFTIKNRLKLSKSQNCPEALRIFNFSLFKKILFLLLFGPFSLIIINCNNIKKQVWYKICLEIPIPLNFIDIFLEVSYVLKKIGNVKYLF